MICKNSHEENNIYIGHSFGTGMDGDIGSDLHQSIRDDRLNANSVKNASNSATSHILPSSEVAQSGSAAFSSRRPTVSEADVNNRAAIAEQGNLFSMAQSVRNLGFIPNMNMALNHQQINALNASLHAAGTINNVNFPALRNSMFVPDANVSLSNTNGFPNNHHHGFSTDFMPLPHNRNHGPFSVTEPNMAAAQSKTRTPTQYYGTQSLRIQGSVGDETTMLHGNSSNAKNEERGNKLEVKRRGVHATGSLPFAKRSRHENLTPAQQRLGSPSASKWAETPGRSISLYGKKDEENLSQYQCLARQQMELFEATSADAGNNAQGRNRPILPGQIGIRCKHCYKLPSKQRKTGSVYYPNKVCITIVIF